MFCGVLSVLTPLMLSENLGLISHASLICAAELKLIAAVPFPGFADKWTDEWQQKFEKLLKSADFVKIVSEDYSKDAYQARNEWMVNHSSRVIAVYDGKAGGTRNTIQYAWKNHVPVKYLKG